MTSKTGSECDHVLAYHTIADKEIRLNKLKSMFSEQGINEEKFIKKIRNNAQILLMNKCYKCGIEINEETLKKLL